MRKKEPIIEQIGGLPPREPAINKKTPEFKVIEPILPKTESLKSFPPWYFFGALIIGGFLGLILSKKD